MLPDGSMGWPNALITTDEIFTPFTIDEIRAELSDHIYRHFRVVEFEHYLVYTQGSTEFARQSGVLLESLYEGLLAAFKARGLEVHESEFPLVAVIYRRESDFRENHQVSADVQACYDPITNRIYFYEHRDLGLEDARFAAMRKPQTVAHEGTHQLLVNIGIQPRLASWPIWLTEGLAEICSPPTTNRGEWAGFNQVISSHLATIDDLEDSMAIQGRHARLTRSRIGLAPGRSTIEYLFRCETLNATDYSLAWGVTHYLMNQKPEAFVRYLQRMGSMPPLVKDSAESRIRDFQSVFGDDLAAMGQEVHRYLASLKRPENLPFYAVVFEQPIEPGVVRRGTLVSQSPLVIRQWVETMGSAFTAPYEVQVLMYTSRAAAFSATESWLNHR